MSLRIPDRTYAPSRCVPCSNLYPVSSLCCSLLFRWAGVSTQTKNGFAVAQACIRIGNRHCNGKRGGYGRSGFHVGVRTRARYPREGSAGLLRRVRIGGVIDAERESPDEGLRGRVLTGVRR